MFETETTMCKGCIKWSVRIFTIFVILSCLIGFFLLRRLGSMQYMRIVHTDPKEEVIRYLGHFENRKSKNKVILHWTTFFNEPWKYGFV